MSADNWTHTWDGVPIASDEPHGSAVHVRRRRAAGEVEFLLLHRAHHGPDFAGDWAWTSPAGARQPDEAVYEAALRELAEEAGLSGHALWPVDLSGRWAHFVCDVDPGVVVDLVDPEHDSWRWVAPDEAAEIVLPPIVGAQFAEVVSARAGGVEFAPLSEADLPDVVRWQQSAHAREWFVGGPDDVEAALTRYGSRLRGESPTRMWRVSLDGVPAGYLQAYPISAYEDYAIKTRDSDAVAFDYVIGEPELVGRRWGRAMIWAFLRDVLLPEYPTAPRFVASPDHRNRRSLRVLDACGFRQGLWIDISADAGRVANTEIVCTFDRQHWFGDLLDRS